MKDENGIEICCENCKFSKTPPRCKFGSLDCLFIPSANAYKARIAELQKELNIVQESERAEAQEADRLRAEVKELEKKLTETIKLLSERSRECGKLQALLEVKNRSNTPTQPTNADDVAKKNRQKLDKKSKKVLTNQDESQE